MNNRVHDSRFTIHNSRWVIPLAIVLCAFALRVYRLGMPSLHGDEAFSAQFTAQSFEGVIAALGSYEPNPPFYYALLWPWLRMASTSEFALRFLSAWWGVFLIPWAYDLGRRLGGMQLGATTALLAAVSPFLIWHSQEARMYALLATIVLASVALLVRAWQSSRPVLWWAWAAVTWLALSTHYFAAFLTFAEVIVLLVSLTRFTRSNERIAQLKAWVVPWSAIGLLYLPWAVYVAPAMLTHKKSWILPIGLEEFFRRTFIIYSLGTTPAPWAVRWLWPGFMLILAGGIVALARKRRWEAGLLTSCLLMPLAIVYLLSLLRPMFHERYLIYVLPPYLLFLASGVTVWAQWIGAYPRWSMRVLATVPMAFLIVASGFSLLNYFHDPNYAKSPPWREMIQSLQTQVQPGDIVIQNYPDPSLTYYLSGRIPYTLVPGNVPFSQHEVERALTDLMRGHRRLWLVPTRSADWDAEGLVEMWLDRHGDLVDQQEFGSLRLRLYLSPVAFLGPGLPLAQLDGMVQLLDYRLSYEKTPVKPGDVLYLSLYWQSDAPLTVSYKVFTHLLDATGWMRGQRDNPPVGGTYPTTEWQPGEVIVDRYEIAIPPDAPPGNYRLAVGMYDGTTLERLPVQEVFCESCPVPVYASEGRVFLPIEIGIGEQ
jgi:mannosyltransferase